MTTVQVSYFSDVLCIWAYAAQARVDAVKEKFGDTVRLELSVLLCIRRYGPEDYLDLARQRRICGVQCTFANSRATVSAYRSPSGNLAENARANISQRAFVYVSGPAMGARHRSTRPKRFSNINLR